MITYEEAAQLQQGDEVHYGECLKEVASRGGIHIAIERWLVVGPVRTQIKYPGEWFLHIQPPRHDLKTTYYLSHYTAHLFHLATRCIVKEAQ